MTAAANFRARVLARQTLVGTFLKTPTGHGVEIMGDAGFDFVVIDQEHAPFDRSSTDVALAIPATAGAQSATFTARGSAEQVQLTGAAPGERLTLFDKQVQLRMGQANVKKWVDDIMPLLTDADPLGVDSFATHTLPLEDAPHAYDIFQRKADGAVKIILKP